MDLVVDLNFRMDTTALYSDIILPAATWYEKADMNSTDMHAFIHPLAPAVAAVLGVEERLGHFPCDLEKLLGAGSEHLPGKTRDVLLTPLAHDSPAEMAQPTMADWTKGEWRSDSGEDDAPTSQWSIAITPISTTSSSPTEGSPARRALVRTAHLRLQGLSTMRSKATKPVERWEGEAYPSLKDAEDAANVVLALSTVTKR